MVGRKPPMEYKTYLARKRLKKLVICGHVNIPYGTAVTNELSLIHI